MEEYFETQIEVMGKPLYAKSQICLAHDWYEMGDDDKGSLLLERAEKVCPGYFTNEMYKHMDEDPLFDHLVKRLTSIILAIAGSIADGANK